MKYRLLFVLALGMLLRAQEDPRMVDLNVIALDSHGDPVTDLTVDDFRITDSGKSQTIAVFHHRDNRLAKLPPLGPNEFSNRTAANVPRATLILFDLMNEKFETRGVAANRLVQALESLDSSDFVYLYLLTLSGRLYPVRGLPGSEGEVSPPGEPWTKHAKPILDQALKTVLQVRPPEADVAWRTQMTYIALDQIAIELSRVPGRKSIVWITDGVPIELGPNRSDTGDWVDFTPLLRRMSEGMDRAGVSIYPVRQINIGSAATLDGPNSTGMGSADTLDQFAQMTGGRTDRSKDIAPALRQAISDLRTSYQIGFYPPDSNWDDKFHKLRVTCSRKGVHIQTKTGYYAWREAPGSRAAQAVQDAILTRFDAAEIGLRASLTADPKGGRMIRLEAHIDANDVVLVPRGGNYLGELRLAIAGYQKDTKPQSGPLVPIDLHYSAEDRDRALQQGIAYEQELDLGASIRAVRLIVYDRNSNAIGSVTMPAPAGPK